MDELIKLRRTLHAYPEIGGKEHETKNILLDYIRDFRPKRVFHEIGKTGFAVEYDSGNEGPTIMFRSELDALPIEDKLDISYRSQYRGVGHKCGHDGHMATVAGLARYLYENPLKKGRVVLMYQPAEETGEGAEWVVNDPKFKEIEPDYIYAYHNLPGVDKHQVVVRDEVFASASIGVEVKLMGRSSHAAHPENGRNPAIVVGELIQAVETINDPKQQERFKDFILVTVVHLLVGSKRFGTTPGYGEFRATLRAYLNDDLEELKKYIRRIVSERADHHLINHTLKWKESFSSTQNNKEAAEQVRQAVRACGKELLNRDSPFRWSEDFGGFTSRYKGAMFGIGAGNEHEQLHSSRYDFPDEIINTGVCIFQRLIEQHLGT